VNNSAVISSRWGHHARQIEADSRARSGNQTPAFSERVLVESGWRMAPRNVRNRIRYCCLIFEFVVSHIAPATAAAIRLNDVLDKVEP
jgi:hypothetical protein